MRVISKNKIEKIYKILCHENITRYKMSFSEASKKALDTIRYIKHGRICTIGEHGATLWCNPFDGSETFIGTYYNTIPICALIAGVPVVDARRASWDGKNLMIRGNTQPDYYLSIKDELEACDIRLFNFKTTN